MIGTRLSQYQITATLGAGGMGEVFRARDTRLSRDVAVKVLPKAFASDADRLHRFEQESKTLAALNHPNILTIHDAGVHEGAPYLVSELLEGQTLREALGGANGAALPARKAMDYALQIAHGLAAAHSKGIIHRDLKPENIFITKDGRVKILDFGLAKLQSGDLKSQTSNLKSQPDEAATLLQTTQPGLALGTPAYMSPEQVRGEPADHRSDIFSFGCVLYEMLTGTRAFRRDTPVESMNAVLREEPSELSTMNPTISPALDRVVRRCLEKDPERRFQSATDLAFAIENAGATSRALLKSLSGGGPPSKFSVRPVLLWALAALALALALTGWLRRRPASLESRAPSESGPGSVRKFELTLGLPSQKPVSSGATPVLSPDGQKIVYANPEGLWLRWMNQLTAPVLLAKGNRITAPFWSPRSTEVGYFDGARLYRVGITGGSSILVTTGQGRAGPGTAGGAWLEDDRVVFTTGPSSPLLAVSSEGGTATNLVPLSEEDWDFHQPCSLPGGRGLLFVVHRKVASSGDTLAAWTPSGGRKLVLQLPGSIIRGPVCSPTGHVVFQREEDSPGIWAFRFSVEKLERTGPLFRVSDTGTAPSISNSGTLIFSFDYSDDFSPRRFAWVDRSGQILKTIEPAKPGLSSPNISPDAKHIVAAAGSSFEAFHLWIFDVSGGGAFNFTSSQYGDQEPSWTDDGRSILFTRRLGMRDEVRTKAVTGDAREQLVAGVTGTKLSRSGRYLLAQQSIVLENTGIRSKRHVGYITMTDKDHRFVAFPEALQSARFPALSPDDRLLAFQQSNESGESEIYLVDFPGFSTVKSPVSRGGDGQHAEWNPNGTELFYEDLKGEVLMSAKLNPDGRTTEEPKQLFKLPPSIHGGYAGWPSFYDVAADGQRFLMLQKVQDKSDTNTVFKPDFVLVQNWIEEFPDKK